MSKPDKYQIAANCHLAGIDNGEWHRLTASQQREIFGYVPFGKREIMVDTDQFNEITARRKCRFGDSGEILTLEEVAKGAA